MTIYNEEGESDKGDEVIAAPLAVYLGEHIQENNNDIQLDNPPIIMHNCKIVSQDEQIIIEGIINNTSEIKPENPYILIKTENNELKNLTYQLYQLEPLEEGGYKYQMILKPTNDFNADLDQSLGRLDNSNNIILSFEKNENSEVYFSKINNKFYNKLNSSNGLSGGTIVAIILPIIAILIAVAAIIYLVKKRSSIPPSDHSLYNDTGYESSTHNIN